MRRGWRKKAIFGGVGLLAVLATTVGGLRAWLGWQLSEDAIVAEMERNYNSRVVLGSRELALFSNPGRVEIESITIVPRDDYANEGVAASERPPLDAEPALHLERAVITMNLLDMIRGNLDIETVEFSGFSAAVRLTEDGDNIGPLFDDPEIIDGGPNPKLVEERRREAERQERLERERAERRRKREEEKRKARAEGRYEEWKERDEAERAERKRKEEEEEDDDDEDEPFMADDLKMRLLIARGDLEDAEVTIRTEDGGTLFTLDELSFGLDDVDVDPDALKEINRADLEVAGRLTVRALPSTDEIAEVRFSGAGTMEPFDPASGEWLPDIELDVRLLRGSRFSGLPMFQSIGKWFEVLASLGLKMTGLDLAGALEEDAGTSLRYHNGRYDFTRQFDLVFENYRITVNRGAWIDGSEDDHFIEGSFLGDGRWTRTTLASLGDFVDKLAGNEAAGRFLERVEEVILDEDGRFRLEFTSKGPMSDPDVEFRQKISDLKDAVKDVGRDALRNLFD